MNEKKEEYKEYKEHQKSKDQQEKEITEFSQIEKDEYPLNLDENNKFTKLEKKQIEEAKKEQKTELKDKVLTFLAKKEDKTATEHLAKAFQNLYYPKTIRDDSTEEIYIYDDQRGIYIPKGKTYIKEFVRDIVGFEISTQKINEVILKIVTDTYINEDFFLIQNKDEIVLKNGIYDLKKKILKRFTPRKIFFNNIPIKYKPGIKPEKTINFISEIVENPDDVDLIQELLGYCLYNDYQIEKAFMFNGSGRNGKGQLLELIKNFIGVDNTTGLPLQRLTDENGFNIQELQNKLVNLGGDISDTYLQDTGIFKSLTGNDLVSVKRKFLNDVKFRNKAKLIFSCNNLPSSKDNSRGFWDRWILINFPYRFEHQEVIDTLNEEEKENVKLRENSIVEKITTEKELSGVLNWALEGLNRLLKQGHFTLTKSTKDVRERWIRTADSFAAFCEDKIEEDYGAMIKKSDLKRAYHNYCKFNKIQAVSDVKIKNYLTKELGAYSSRCQIFNEGQIYIWQGIKFSQGSQSSQGFSTLGIFNKNEYSSKSIATSTTLTKKDKSEEDILQGLSPESSINDIVRVFKEKNTFLEENLKKYFSDGILQKAKEFGFIFENKRGVYSATK